MHGFGLNTCHVAPTGNRPVVTESVSVTKPWIPIVHLRNRRTGTLHSRSGSAAKHICNSDRSAAPVAEEVPSPDGAAALEHSEQFKVHLLAALEDPRVQEKNEVTPEIQTMVDQLKSVSPEDRKKVTMDGIKGTFRGVLTDIERMTKDGITDLGTMSFKQFKPIGTTVKCSMTTLKIGVDWDNQYQVEVPMTFQDGPLAGVQAKQVVSGDYRIDDNEPTKQKIGFTALKLSLDTSDSAAKEKWLDVMRKENDKMDDEGKISLTFNQPMQAWRDFLFFDEQLQISIGNRGSMTIIQQ
ncbi:hypothetical protein ABBQ32_007197 [Trebouxia sp. C0010 RCD-2024]